MTVARLHRIAEVVWAVACVYCATLNWILYTTGSQCSSFGVGRTWSRSNNPRSRRAAAFWTRCKGAIVENDQKRVTVVESAEKEGAD